MDRNTREVWNYIGNKRSACSKPLDGVFLEFQHLDKIKGQARTSSEGEIELALAEAEIAFSTYGNQHPEEKAAYLEKIASELDKKISDIAQADCDETGVNLETCKTLAQIVPHSFRRAASQARNRDYPSEFVSAGGQSSTLFHKPWGPALCLSPWNAPTPLSAHKVASALAAGCSVILKPSEYTPSGPQLLAEAIAEADLPRGLFQLVHGGRQEGGLLVRDERIKAVSFTGGLDGGQKVGKACMQSMKPVQLELGGHNPLIIMQDADLEAALHGIRTGLITMNGQWCRAVGQILVHASHWEKFWSYAEEILSGITIGPAHDAATDLGPLFHSDQKNRLELQIQAWRRKGAEIKTYGNLPKKGSFLAPTLLTGIPLEEDQHEFFGPVATVHLFDDTERLWQNLRKMRHGLQAYIYSRDTEKAIRLGQALPCGGVKINGVSLRSLHPEAPRSAWGISGYGEEGEAQTFEFFRGPTLVGICAPT